MEDSRGSASICPSSEAPKYLRFKDIGGAGLIESSQG